LTVEELRKKAADFIEVIILLFRNNKIKNKKRKKLGLKRNDINTIK